MKTLSVSLIAWLVAMMLVAPLADAAGNGGKGFAQYSTDTIKKHDESCDCCMKCRAATKDVKPKDNGYPAAKGCRSCCERCGEKLPTDKDNIPEIIK